MTRAAASAGDGGLEHQPHVEELVAADRADSVRIEASGATRRLTSSSLREGALPVARLEQADRLERAEGVADRAAADAEARRPAARSAGSGWPAGSVPSRISTRMRSAISSATRVFRLMPGWPDDAAGCGVDTPRSGCQTRASLLVRPPGQSSTRSGHGFAHGSRMASDGQRSPVSSHTGSPQIASSDAIETFALARRATSRALVVPWESDAIDAQHGGAPP